MLMWQRDFKTEKYDGEIYYDTRRRLIIANFRYRKRNGTPTSKEIETAFTNVEKREKIREIIKDLVASLDS